VELIERDDALPLSKATEGITDHLRVHGLVKAGVIVDDFDQTVKLIKQRGVEIAYGPFPAKNSQRASQYHRQGQFWQLDSVLWPALEALPKTGTSRQISLHELYTSCTKRMRLLIALFAASLTLCGADTTAEREARKTMDAFMEAFNARDPQAWAATLNYPHVRFASNTVRIYNTAEDFTRENKDYPARLAPWHHSRWESMNVIQSGPDKVHIAVTFVRYDANNKEIGKFPSLYVVTSKDGHWGVQARSSFAP